MIPDLLASGFNGLRNNMRGLHESASDIARFSQHNSASTGASQQGDLSSIAGTNQVPPGLTAEQSGVNPAQDMTEAMVGLKIYEQAFGASARVVEVANENLGSLLDVTA